MVDDGSCEIGGCLEPSNVRFFANATFNDGSCAVQGCTLPSALNYNPFAQQPLDGSCLVELPGCTLWAALNYDSRANRNNNKCVFQTVIS